MLHGRHLLPTIPARDQARARAWYADRLGLTTGQEEPEALLYRSGEGRPFRYGVMREHEGDHYVLVCRPAPRRDRARD